MNSFVDNLTMGMVNFLEKQACVCDVTVVQKDPADKVALTSWEQRNGCQLPADVRNFYSATDGLQIRWSLKVKGEPLPVGLIEINSIAKLRRVAPKRHGMHSDLPTLLDVEGESSASKERGYDVTIPKFRERCKAFLLDPCQGSGKVCLVYPGRGDSLEPSNAMTPSVWFLDRALEWTYLASSLTSYLRLSLVHLGLSQWQYALCPGGPSPRTKQLLKMFVPDRLEADTSHQFEPMIMM